MYASSSSIAEFDQVDLYKSKETLNVWIRSRDVALCLDADEGRWLLGALQSALAAIPETPKDAPDGEVFVVRSPSHPLFKPMAPPEAAVTQREPLEENQIAGPHGKHSAFNDPPDPPGGGAREGDRGPDDD